MPRTIIQPTGVERKLGVDEIIVSKTDLRGHITYANRTFLRIADYTENDLLGQPHNIIRHPGMPRAVFRLLWNTVQAGQEIFAYVVNLTKGGDHYWVFAHVTPTFDEHGTITGYHSNRRSPSEESVIKVQALYGKVLAEEQKHPNPLDAASAGLKMLTEYLSSHNVDYNTFIFSL